MGTANPQLAGGRRQLYSKYYTMIGHLQEKSLRFPQPVDFACLDARERGAGFIRRAPSRHDVTTSTGFVMLIMDTVVCVTPAKWETVLGQFAGYRIHGALRRPDH